MNNPIKIPDVDSLLDDSYKHLKEDNNFEAIRELTMLIDYFPEDIIGLVFAYWARSQAYENVGKYLMALEDIDEAIRLSPDLFDCMLFNRISIYKKMGFVDYAIKDYEKLIRIFKDSPQNEETRKHIRELEEELYIMKLGF